MWSSLLAALVVLLPWPVSAAISCVDAGATVEVDATPADPDLYPTYTAPSGDNKITIVGTGYRQSGATNTPTVTIGGNAMTSATSGQYTDPNGGQLWYRLAVAEGSANVSVNWAGVPLASVIGVVTCTGVDQATPIRTTNQAGGADTTPTVTVTGCLAGDVIVDFVTRDGAAQFTVGADQTEISQPTASEMNGAMSRQAGGGDNVMSWTHTSEQWTIQAVCLAPAASEEMNGGPLWFE